MARKKSYSVNTDTWKVKVRYFVIGALSFFGCLFLTVYLVCPHCEDEQDLVLSKVERITDNIVEKIIG